MLPAREIDEMLMIAPSLLSSTIFAATSRVQEHAGEVDVDHRLPLGQAHLADFAILDLEQQAVAQDAGIVDQPMQATEVLGDARDHLADLLLAGDVAQVGAGLATGGLAGGHGFVQAVLVEVHQGQACAPACQVLGHGAAEALAAAGDDDDLVLQLHARLLVVLVKRERRPPGNRYAGRSVVPDRIEEPQVSAEARKHARQLLLKEYRGVLSTHSQAMPGFPFGSVVPYCLTRVAGRCC